MRYLVPGNTAQMRRVAGRRRCGHPSSTPAQRARRAACDAPSAPSRVPRSSRSLLRVALGPARSRGRLWRPGALELLLDRLAAHHVLRLGEVSHHVQLLQPIKLGDELCPARSGLLCSVRSGLANSVEKEVEQRLIGAEVANPVDELLLEGLSLDDRLPAGIAIAPRRAHVAAHRRARVVSAAHAGAAALAAQRLGQQVLIRGRPGLYDARAPRAHSCTRSNSSSVTIASCKPQTVRLAIRRPDCDGPTCCHWCRCLCLAFFGVVNRACPPKAVPDSL